MDPLPPDPYKALGVDKDAEIAAIRSAHRKLVMRCHPDKVPDKVEKFQAVQQAYELLSNEEERRNYDDRVKRDALRAEKATYGGGPDFATGAGPGPVYEVHREIRGGKIYSTRAPRGPWDDEPRPPPHKHKSSEEDDDYFSHKTEKARSNRYEESYFDAMPRRSSGRSFEDRPRRARDIEEDLKREERDRRYVEKEASRAYEKKMRAERERMRGRDRKRETETKFKARTSYGDYSESSDSDRGSAFTRKAEPKRKYEEPRRRFDREDGPRRSKRGNDSYSDEYDKEAEAMRHIQKTRGSAYDNGPKRPPGFDRFHTTMDARPPPPPPPVPAALPNDVRRSSGRRASTRDTSPIKLPTRERDRRNIEIVKPRGSPPSLRRPGMPGLSSDPRGLKGMPTSKKSTQKSATLDDIPEARHPFIRRSETMPNQPRHRDTLSTSKGPKLKETHDSGYSSPGTPEMKNGATPFMKSTKYPTPIVESPSSDSDEETIVLDDKGGMYHKGGSGRGSLDKDHRRSKSDRPPLSSGAHKHSSSSSAAARGAPLRAGSYAYMNDTLPTRPPPLSRAETSHSSIPPPLSKDSSARGGPRGSPLFGEVKGENSPKLNKPDIPYRIVREQSKLSAEDINFVNYGGGRRGSEDTTGGRERDRYPGSHHFPERERRREARVH